MVVNPERPCVGVRDLELVWGSGPALNEVLRAEPVGIKSRNEHQFIRPFPEIAQNLYSRLVPCAREHSVLPLHPVGSEELGRKVVTVRQPHRNDDHSSSDLESVTECLLEPELLQSHLASTLDLTLIFTSLIRLQFHSAFSASVLELDLRAERPPLSEIIAKVDDKVRNVEPPVALVILILLRMVVPLPSVAVEVAGHHRLAVATYRKPLSISAQGRHNQHYRQ